MRLSARTIQSLAAVAALVGSALSDPAVVAILLEHPLAVGGLLSLPSLVTVGQVILRRREP